MLETVLSCKFSSSFEINTCINFTVADYPGIRFSYLSENAKHNKCSMTRGTYH